MAPRTDFTSDDDNLLMKYIATYNPEEAGRTGNLLYERLTENKANKWAWSDRHPWQSWRERYKKNKSAFDRMILEYQKKHGIRPTRPSQYTKPPKPFSARPAESESDDEDPTPRKAVKRKRESVGLERDGKRTRDATEDVREEVGRVAAKPVEAEPAPQVNPEQIAANEREASRGVSERGRASECAEAATRVTGESTRAPKASDAVHHPHIVAPPSPLTARVPIQDTRPSPSPRPRQSTQEPDSGVDVRSPPPALEEEPPASRKFIIPPVLVPARTNTISLPASPTPAPKLRQRRPSPPESDLFVSAPGTPQSSPSTVDRPVPPRLVEGPFSNSFTDKRGRLRNGHGDDSDSDDGDWPPRRGTSRRLDKGKGKAIEQRPEPVIDSTRDTKPHRIFPQRVAALNPMIGASTSLPNLNPFRQAPQHRANATRSLEEAEAGPSNLNASSNIDRRVAAMGSHRPRTLDQNLLDEKSTRNPLSRHTRGSSDPENLSVTSRRVPSQPPKAFRFPKPRIASTGSTGDPFTVRHDTDQKARRQTFGGFQPPPPPPPNLFSRAKRGRESLPSNILPSSGRSAGSNLSMASNMSTPDQSLIWQLGYDAMLQMMSRNHKFTTDVIERVYNEVGDFKTVDEILRKMREQAEATAVKCLEDALKASRDHDDEDTTRQFFQHPSGSRQQLQFTPNFVEDDRLSDYRPPTGSRAGQFVRLAKQCRKSEALERDWRRSRVSISPQKDQGRVPAQTDAVSSPQVLASAGHEQQSPTAHLTSRNSDLAPKQVSAADAPFVWGEAEDAIIFSKDPVALAELEKRVGVGKCRRRFLELRKLRRS